MDGDWDSPDLTALLRFVIAQPQLMGGGLDGPVARLQSGLRRFASVFSRNTRSGSRRNISAHYDLGNDLFERMLDPSMTYSSAYFREAGMSLEQAQAAKYDRICQGLGFEAGMRVVEIGTGWGGFALHAARNYGVHVTTTTISKEQHAYAAERIRKAGLESRVRLLREDYRDLKGRYDRLVSIEMIEAVGAEYFPGYFERCSDLLEDDGAMSIQAIVIGDQNYEAARRHVDFIRTYIFPGGCLPSIAVMAQCIAEKSDLRVQHLLDITADYAETLRRWRSAFEANSAELATLGADEVFQRMWNYYLSYCEAGFEERHIGCVQLDMTKPGWRPSPAGTQA